MLTDFENFEKGDHWREQLSDSEKERVDVVVNGIREFSPEDEAKRVFIGGGVKKGKPHHHILVAVRIPEEAVPFLLRHVRSALDHAQLPSVFDESLSTIAQPQFLGSNELSTSGKPIYVAIGRKQLERNVNEIVGRLI